MSKNKIKMRVYIPLPETNYPIEILEFILPGLIESIFNSEHGKLEHLIASCILPNFITASEIDIGDIGLRRLMYFDELIGEFTMGFNSNIDFNFKYVEHLLKSHEVTEVEIFHRGDKCILHLNIKY